MTTAKAASRPAPAKKRSRRITSNNLTARKLTAVRDKRDDRDLVYRGSLALLPESFTASAERVPFILDQGAEGACTSFSCAASILFYTRPRLAHQGPSTRMLYTNALDNDEFRGDDPEEGSSLRGVLKGFRKFGCCREKLYPYAPDGKFRRLDLSPEAKADCVAFQLGNYFRIPTDSITMIQSALLETGILMASCATTKHWDDPTSGYIKYDPKEPDDSGHAFAIVGWTGDGHFIIQNSWGYDWGVGFGKHPAGFGFLHFYDWLQHGFDCYAIRLAAKTPFLINI